MIRRIFNISLLFLLFAAVSAASAYLTLRFFIKGEKTVVVPDVVTKDVVHTLEELGDLGLNTRIKGLRYSDRIAKHHVIQQTPAPGSEIKKGRDVAVILSRGSEQLRMPNVTGLALRQARIILDQNGLCAGMLSRTPYQKHFLEDQVIAQTPATGQTVRRGRCVDLLISTGPRPAAFKMIDLKGLSVDEAVVLLEKSRLRIGAITYETRPRLSENIVTGHAPEYGYRVLEKTPVDLVVSRRAGADRPMPAQIRTAGFFRHRLKVGFTKKRVQVRMDSMGISIRLYDGLMAPDEELWLLVPTSRPATVFVYEDGDLVAAQVFGDEK